MRSLIALSALALAACAAETSSPAIPGRWEVVQGDSQRATLGAPLDSLVGVRLLDDAGRPMPAVAVTWRVSSGGGRLSWSTPVTDGEGIAWASWDAGLGPDPQTLTLSTLEFAPIVLTGLPDPAEFISLAVGAGFGCGLDADGIAWCWGSNYEGNLGTDSLYWSATPVRIGEGTLRFSELVAGLWHVCGRQADGTVLCWGDNSRRQLGRITAGPGSAVPTAPSGLPPLASIDAGDFGTCGVATDTSLWCWGAVAGQATRPVPSLEFPGTGFREIALGDNFACGILADSTVACWGDNTFGQLGQGTTTGSSAALRPITAPISATGLDASSIGACAVTAQRDLYCWGEMAGMPGHGYADATKGSPSRSAQDFPVLRISLGYYCGAVWRSPSSPRLLCPQSWTRDIEALPAIVEVKFGSETLCLRAAGGVTYCKSYSDAAGPRPFDFSGTGINAPLPAP